MAKADENIDGADSRAQRALHRFTQQLEADVQDALDAAKSRRLAPFESIEQYTEYLLARFVAPAQGRALPKHLPRKPTGLAVGADLAAGLKAVEPHLLDACVRQLHAAIDMCRPFDGKPFARKPLVVRRGTEQGSKQVRKSADEEEQALERLEQAGVDVVQLFREAVENLTAQASIAARRPAAKPDDKRPNELTPPQLAEEWEMDVDKIYAFIRSGELRATNTAINRGGRPRYKISRQDAEDFKRRRQNSPPPPRSPRRKKFDLGGKEFY